MGNCNLTDKQIIELHPNIFLIKGKNSSSHTYLLRTDYKNILIDSGIDKNFPDLRKSLLFIGIKIRDIDIIINTHEHFDHIGANRYFQEHALIAAHRFAAVKISTQDKYVTLYESGDLNEPAPKVHLWLENRFRFDLGNFSIEVIHTPGHTSGSICLYELNRKILFSGDTLFAGGELSYIAESGSIGDYIYSISHLATRKINEIYPGHGDISKNPEDDMKKSIEYAKALLNNDKKGVHVTNFREES